MNSVRAFLFCVAIVDLRRSFDEMMNVEQYGYGTMPGVGKTRQRIGRVVGNVCLFHVDCQCRTGENMVGVWIGPKRFLRLPAIRVITSVV